jgi:hypothetical protein
MWRKILRIVVPTALVAVLLGWLTGCLFIPTFPHVVRGKDIHKMLGDENSRKPIRIGITKSQVVALLGDGDELHAAQFRSPWLRGKNVLSYSWTTEHGTWIGLCYPGFWRGESTPRTTHIATLEFDEDDVLKAYEIDVRYSDATGYRETRVPPLDANSK